MKTNFKKVTVGGVEFLCHRHDYIRHLSGKSGRNTVSDFYWYATEVTDRHATVAKAPRWKDLHARLAMYAADKAAGTLRPFKYGVR